MSVDKFPDWIFEFCTRLTNDLTKAKISVGPHFFFIGKKSKVKRIFTLNFIKIHAADKKLLRGK